MTSVAACFRSVVLAFLATISLASAATVGVRDRLLTLDGRPFPLWGIRVASASQTQPLTDQLIANLDDYRAHGVNAISVFYMGSLGLHTDPFSPDGNKIDPAHQARMEQIIRACDRRGMVAMVGIFYQRAQPPHLRDWAAVENSVRTIAAALRPHRNVILNIANEQNSAVYKGLPWEAVREPASLLDLCRIAKLADPARLIGAGGYDHAKNEIVGASPHVDVLLYDTKDPAERDVDLHRRFAAAGVRKPMVNIELFGGWTKQWQPPGVYPAHAQAPHLAAIDDVAAAQARGEGLYISFHSSPWCQGTADPNPREPMRFDLGGQGTPDAPGMRWFFEHLRAKTKTAASAAPAAPTPSSPRALYFPPPGESLDRQSRRTPAEAGFNPGIVAALEGAAPRWALWRDGHLVHVEGDFNQPVDVASLRKTWFALGVGAAIQQRKIPSYDQKISVFETDLTGHHALATWRHVMLQASAFDYPYGNHPAYKPGEIWTYSDHNPMRLTSALAKAYGRSHMHEIDRVLRAAYFDAIGLRGWKTSKLPNDDGPRLHLDLEDMGRLGLLVLARGNWDGQQLVPRAFVEELETKQTRGMKINYDGPYDGRPTTLYGHEAKYPEAPYGYMTWVNTDRDVYPHADRAWAWGSGKGGHFILWNRNLGIVFAASGRDRDIAVPELVEAHLSEPR